ncbi:hypothetical protein [Hamadaea tsunoensis]|uniref:hypothetical protein n=1 Tax=Hamadaea tsunoensis TaxID=53368 RepID=UPI001B7F8806|nr:hypothetical protein [Hamadaea tsunoensis]
MMQDLIALAKTANTLRANPRLDKLDGFVAQLDAAAWESPLVFLPTAALSSSATRLRGAHAAVAGAGTLLGQWEGAAGDAARQATGTAADRLGGLADQLEDDLLPAIEAFANRLNEITTICEHCGRELTAVRQFLPQVRAAADLADPAAPEIFRRIAARTFETLFQLTNAYSEYMQVSADLVRLLHVLGDGLRAGGNASPAPARSLA